MHRSRAALAAQGLNLRTSLFNISMISTEPPYLTSQRFLEEIQVLFYEPFFQKHGKERWKTSTTPLATR